MKKRVASLLILVLPVLTMVPLALATEGQPQGGCPDNFHLHMAMEHEHGSDGQHQHVGNSRDRNGDGYICGKHVSADGSIHVHIDNNVPLP